jgi:hypothetical protein
VKIFPYDSLLLGLKLWLDVVQLGLEISVQVWTVHSSKFFIKVDKRENFGLPE